MSETKQPRRHRTAEEKAALLKRHPQDKVPISQICAEEQMQPCVFHEWMRGWSRDWPCGRPPPQIRASGAAAHGSYLGFWRRSARWGAGAGCGRGISSGLPACGIEPS